MPNNHAKTLKALFGAGIAEGRLAETEKALGTIATHLVTEARNNLQQNGQSASGTLADSFKALPLARSGKGITIAISAAPYYDFVNKGVKGTKGGKSTGGYAFKNSYPSKTMIVAISKWMKQAKHATFSAPGRHKISGRPKSRASATNTANAKAYAISRAIKIRGIKGSGYLDKAIESAQKYAQQTLGEALAADIRNALGA